MNPLVAIDANVLGSGIAWPRWPHEVLRHALRGGFGLALSPLVVEQTRRWLAEIASGYLPQLESFLEHCGYVPIPAPGPDDVRANAALVRDITDVPVALAAIQAGARILVSEDRDLTRTKAPPSCTAGCRSC